MSTQWCHCVCRHHFNAHRGGTGECELCPCKVYAEALHDYPVNITVVGERSTSTFFFPTRRLRRAFIDGFRRATYLLHNEKSVSIVKKPPVFRDDIT